jgi:O-antigen/teichoic acid export membrane protein
VTGSADRRPQAGPNLSHTTFAGLRWSYVDAIGNALIQLVWVSLSSRLLPTEVFGLMAVAALTVQFGMFFSRMGVAHALVQRQEITDDDVRASATSGLVTGLLCFGVLWVAAPWVGAAVFSDPQPEVVGLLRVLGVSFVLTGLAMTSHALLRRQLRFRELAVVHVIANAASLVVGVGLLLAGAGVWALVGNSLTTGAVNLVLLYRRSRHPLRPLWAVRPFKALYSFGARVSMLRLMEFVGKNLDTFFVARFMGAALLGQYSRGYQLVLLPLNRFLSNSLSVVLFPSFSSIQDDPDRLRRGFISVLGLGAMVLLPTCAGLAVAAVEFVEVFLGDRWSVAAQLVPWFAVGAGMSILTHMTQVLCEARAELNRNMAIQAGSLVGLAGMLLVAARFGIEAFAIALLLSEVARHLAFLLLARGVVGLTGRDVLGAYVPALVGSLVVAGLVAGARWLLISSGVPLGVVFAGEVAAGTTALVLAVRFNPFSQIRSQLAMRLRAVGVLRADRVWVARTARLVVGRNA